MRLLLRFVMVFFGTLLAAGLLALAEPAHGGGPQLAVHTSAQPAAAHGVR